jgi:fumarate reductase (CoM/CoB) subunit A
MLELTCDVLVVGGGAAGSRAALEAKRSHPELDVLLAVSGKYGKSGSTQLMASESLGINAPFNYEGDGDNPEIYLGDMMATGGGLSDPALCRIIAYESCARVEDLISLGMKFDGKAGRPAQVKLSGCTKARSLTCGGSTGIMMLNVLKKANREAGVKVLEDVRLLDLVQDDHGRVSGAIGLIAHEHVYIRAGAVILATGGAGRIFRQNVNPPSLEGDGWAMAYRAGAKLVNMEFFQIGPAVMKPKMQFIIHSHMWRLEPKLTNVHGKEFLSSYCPHGVTPSEVLNAKTMSYPFSVRTVAKYLDIAIFKELVSGRGTTNDGVYFDVTHVSKDELMKRAPITYETIKKAGADLAKEKIELGLVVQNFNGGILIDENAFTGVEGLYAAGEASGGVHGSDRPGGNNLIDTQVFGCRAGRAAADYAQGTKGTAAYLPSLGDASARMTQSISSTEADVLKTSADRYYRELTIVRKADGLKKLLEYIEEQKRRITSYALVNRLLLGSLIGTAVLTREESRGTHYREDFPQSNPEWVKRVILARGSDRTPAVTILP